MSRKTQELAKERNEKAQKKRRLALLAAVLAVIALLLCGAGALLRSYPASDAAVAAMAGGTTTGNVTVFMPEEPRAGLIFYPGALVEHEAYAPLMRSVASRGIACLLVEMPLDLAVLDMDAAEGLAAQYPQIDTWMIGGHSLGGAMAAAYAAEHPQEFDALVLLGAYSAKDLSGTDMQVLSVVGSEDGVLDRGKYEESRAHYPQSFTEFAVQGGCHSYFGDYGMQRGDGEPTISHELQIGMTASAIASLLR